MSDAGEETNPLDEVPMSYADLRRSAPGEADSLVRAPRSRDLGDLMAEPGFMQNSKWVGVGAVVVGALLILAAYVRPLFDTVDAVHVAAGVAADQASRQVSVAQGAVGGFAQGAASVRETDMRAINMAKGSLSCLSGKGGCANGGSSPFK